MEYWHVGFYGQGRPDHVADFDLFSAGFIVFQIETDNAHKPEKSNVLEEIERIEFLAIFQEFEQVHEIPHLTHWMNFLALVLEGL